MPRAMEDRPTVFVIANTLCTRGLRRELLVDDDDMLSRTRQSDGEIARARLFALPF